MHNAYHQTTVMRWNKAWWSRTNEVESIATRGIPRLDSSVTLRRPAARE
ncbi:MAG: hypothetical protein OXD40_12815 [bacterium]|nr:hypothetical protein [bacterium]